MSALQSMSPEKYVLLYHNLPFRDPFTGLTEYVKVKKYGSGWLNKDELPQDSKEKPGNRKTGLGPAIQQEAGKFRRALRMLHHGNVHTVCGAKFNFKHTPRTGKAPSSRGTRALKTEIGKTLPPFLPLTDFDGAAPDNVFVGKGSPERIREVLVLALAIGRISGGGAPQGKDAYGEQHGAASPQDYCDRYITLDCNGLVSNYYGVDPQTAVESFAVAGRARHKASEIQPGDALVTLEGKGNYKHIALVDYCIPLPVLTGPDGAETVYLKIVEWGEEWTDKTGPEIHLPPGKTGVELRKGPKAEYGLAYAPRNQNGHVIPNVYRYFFAPPPAKRNPPPAKRK